MKTRLLTIFTLFILLSHSSTAQQWSWVSEGGSSQADIGKHVGIDALGNTYITGTFKQTIFSGQFMLTSRGSNDFFIAKYDAQGNLLWTKSGGGTGDDGTYSLSCKTDSAGNTYVAVTVVGTGYFSQDTLIGTLANAVVLKYDPYGNLLLSRLFGGTGNDGESDINFDKDGNIYLTGGFNNSITFGATILTCTGTYDIYLAKLDTIGNPIWAKKGGGASYNNSGGIAVSNSGSVYLTGYYSNTATFGSFNLTSSGGDDAFFVKYNSSGDVQWAKSAEGSGLYDSGNKIDLDAAGNVYVIGQFANTFTFDSMTIISQGLSDGFIAKLDSNGNFEWIKDIGGSGDDHGYDIRVLENGDHFVAGEFSDTVYYGTDTLVSNGGTDIFVLLNNDQGNSQWTKQTGGTGNDVGYSLESSDKNECYVSGSFFGTVSFDTISNISTGDLDFFVGKIKTSTTGIFSLESNKQLFLYPNPSLSGQTIYLTTDKKFGKELTVSTFDMLGRKVFDKKFANSREEIGIEMGKLSAGVYVVSLVGDNGYTLSGRLVVAD